MNKQVNFYIFGLFFLQLLSLSSSDEPVVTLSTGRVRGLKLVSAVNRSYYSFRSIPYAEPPVGYLRFKAPRPSRSWNGTLEAFEIPPACLQPARNLDYPETYNENCLYINVFTPYMKPPGGVPLPVMVWIHGGKHYQSSSTSYKYGADFLITEDVIVVTFNYRLGVFGYLSSNSKSGQGNAADKDKVAALRWVQREISQFGGDPGSVTIFGGSSGGNDVNCLYLSPMTQGLFHRAVTQSSTNCGVSYGTKPLNPAKRVAEILGCPTSEMEEMVACLRTVPGQILAEKQMEVVINAPGQAENAFQLVVEEDHGEELFMPVSAEELLARSQSTIPYMIGINSGEGKMFLKLNEEIAEQFMNFEKDFEFNLPLYIRENGSKEIKDKIVKTIKKFYFGENPITYKTINDFINYMTDTKFAYFTIQTARSLSSHAPVYLYYFTFEGEFEGVHSFTSLNLPGVCHGEELGYMFYRNLVVPAQNHLTDYPRECNTLTRMVRLWTNFAKYGNPTPLKSDGILSETWLPVEGKLTQHLVIDDTLYMNKSALLGERMAVWETAYSWVQAENESQIYVGTTILAVVLGLAVVCLIYLLYSSSCSKGYTEI